jgi:hypothetical protein
MEVLRGFGEKRSFLGGKSAKPRGAFSAAGLQAQLSSVPGLYRSSDSLSMTIFVAIRITLLAEQVFFHDGDFGLKRGHRLVSIVRNNETV